MNEEAGPIRVLIIDDDKPFLSAATASLESNGKRDYGVLFDVRTADHPDPARDVIIRDRFFPHVVVLDNEFKNVPGGQELGFQDILPAIKRWQLEDEEVEDALKALKIICVSGATDTGDIPKVTADVLAWGATMFLTKQGLLSQDILIKQILRILA